MAYNNYFPMGYQPQMYYPQQQPMQQTQQPMTPPTIHAEIVQVDNEQTAETYPLAAGASQMMIAKDDSAIYVKSMYANGQYNLDTFVKRPKSSKKPDIDPSLYVTREELEKRLKTLLGGLKGKSVEKKTESEEK